MSLHWILTPTKRSGVQRMDDGRADDIWMCECFDQFVSQLTCRLFYPMTWLIMTFRPFFERAYIHTYLEIAS